ncbi:DUF1688 family protein [Roseibium porphyridii]|uniref:DUF1688 family protein n=1 Tax=Roseibium porphyridii TaxID=2866279 RepID=A0ABY8F5Z6_9HYPH|nr:DUF1688 family protein [Roseibium sp. KMA01]WFE89280.1 DUF1688 family protein [Roseibium sp. KMA01]
MSAEFSAPILFQPQEVRRRAHAFLDMGIAGKLNHVGLDLTKLDDALGLVLETTKEIYPDFQIPPYGIWRAFETGGIDRWSAMASAREFESAQEMLLAAADLALLALFMKTRRPGNWVFEDPMTGSKVAGDDALALAAFHMFASGSFSGEMTDPYRVDAETLVRLDLNELTSGLQWDRDADQELLSAMQAHLKRFGEAMALRPDLFSEGNVTRPGVLALRLAGEADAGIDASKLLDNLLETFAPVWDGGAKAGDVGLGDSFDYTGKSAGSETTTVPFHLCAQEMVYSLVEPFAWAGFEVTGLQDLTPPSDLAHAALFVQTGVLAISSENDEALPEETKTDRMVELRAVSAALADKLADRLRSELDVSADQVPLTCILEGGTRRAGLRILSQNANLFKKLGQYLNPRTVFWLPFGA